MARNLIKQRIAANGVPAALPTLAHPSAQFCGEETIEFVRGVSSVMEVTAAEDAAKVPSIMSPAYSFFINLFPNDTLGAGAADRLGLVAASQNARQEFRGIAAALLLRNMLGLDVRLQQYPLAAAGGLRQRFAHLVQSSPGFNVAPWNTQLSYFSLVTGGVSEPFAVLSPYTLFCPAANPLRNCHNLYWYSGNGVWLDPTSANPALGPDRLKPAITNFVREAIYNWLSHILPPDNQLLTWPGLNLAPNAELLITRELRQWLEDIKRLNPNIVASTAVVVAPDNTPGFAGLTLIGERMAYAANGQPAPANKVDPALISDLPVHKGRLLLSKKLVSDKTLRICGLQMGSPALAASLDSLDLKGDNFTLSDGIIQLNINFPYLNVERVFLPTLYQISDGEVSPSFKVLKTANPPTQTLEYWFLPVVKEALEFLDNIGLEAGNPEDFPACVRKTEGQSDSRIVTLTLGKQKFERQYEKPRRDAKPASPGGFEFDQKTFHPNLMDVRVWPNILSSEIHEFYWRIRQLPDWRLSPSFLVKNGGEFQVVKWIDAWQEEFSLPVPLPRHVNAKFYKIDMSMDGNGSSGCRPIGVELSGRGVLVLNLPFPATGHSSRDCTLAVDFGTSNTCVVIKPHGDADQPIRFQLQTDSLHGSPSYLGMPHSPEEGFTEASAPVFDFPFKYGPESWLNDGAFFPTLFATFTAGNLSIASPSGDRDLDTKFRLSYGRMFARNVMLDTGTTLSLLNGAPFAELPPGPDNRPVFLNDNIKNKNIRYRKAFLWDLSMLVKIYMCSNNLVLKRARFSYPRAFLKGKLGDFESQVQATFGKIFKLDAVCFDFLSESHAVYRHTLTRNNADHLVLDIGGGTTDFLATFSGNSEQSFQASYNLASGIINEYFVNSRVFRHIFTAKVRNSNLSDYESDYVDAIASLIELLPKDYRGNAGNSSFAHQAFFGLLSLLNDSRFSNLFQNLKNATASVSFSEVEVQKSIRGFFYSVLLMYAGLAYCAGLLLRERTARSNVLDIHLIGNGSNFYKLLQNIAPMAARSVDNFLASVLSESWGSTPNQIQVRIHPDGKTFVARGLASVSSVPPPSVEYLEESFNYLSGQGPRPQSAKDQTELKKFIKLVSDKIPRGNLMIAGQPNQLVPFCEGSIEDELIALLPGLEVAFQNAERIVAEQCALDFAEAKISQAKEAAAATLGLSSLESAQAREPIFIIHLRTLLEHISDTYGA